MSTRAVSFFAAAALVGCAGNDSGTTTEDIVAGAGYTTFDATLGGCLDSPNGVDCNNYSDKSDVYMSGGPQKTGGTLADGYYYFTVIVPGYQNGGFVPGADGNLSDTTAGATAGDLGTGDAISPERVFHVTGAQIDFYGGSHALGVSPSGHEIIALMPYDDTSNSGGVYILAVCATDALGTPASSPNQCKYDAFRISQNGGGGGTPQFPVISGMKYYDANANGQWDADEVGIAGWNIDYHDLVGGTVSTAADGTFSLTMIADTYYFVEEHPTNLVTLQNGGKLGVWQQTGNTVDQSFTTGDATVILNSDMTYTITVTDNSTAGGIYFGNLCLGAGGGLTLGFWGNKNGAALFTLANLAMLDALNLRNANGSNFDPTGYAQFRTWLLNATATNMAYMLSAQLAAMELNVAHGFVSAGSLIYAPGTGSASSAGYATVGAVMAETNAALGADGLTLSGNPDRALQEALKNALDNANNNETFVQSGPASCPTPVWPSAPL